MSRRNMDASPVTDAFKSSTFSSRTCLRLKASSWRVRAAARSAVVWIRSMCRRTAWSAGSCPSAR
jgi:hypothetical protein